jgi:hypothetical protein
VPTFARNTYRLRCTSFMFLGYTARPRLSASKFGHRFVNCSAAVSTEASCGFASIDSRTSAGRCRQRRRRLARRLVAISAASARCSHVPRAVPGRRRCVLAAARCTRVRASGRATAISSQVRSRAERNTHIGERIPSWESHGAGRAEIGQVVRSAVPSMAVANPAGHAVVQMSDCVRRGLLGAGPGVGA